MSSVQGYFNDVAGTAQAGYGLYNQIDRSLHGDRRKVHFVQGNVTLVEFDLVLNEGHAFSVAPTSFPIESGSIISDHATVAPVQLNFTGLISDYPVETRAQFINSGVTSIITSATQPLGAVGVLGATLGYTALAAQRNSVSRSAKVFDDLQKLAGITSEQRTRAAPQLFDVITRLRRYNSMIITSLQLNRDSTSGPSNMVFTVGLQQVQIAYARTALVQTSIPDKAAPKQALGEADAQTSKLSASSDAGKQLAHQQQDSSTQWILQNLPGT